MARNGSKDKGDAPANAGGDRSGRNNSRPLNWVNPYLDKSDIEWLDAHDHELASLILEFVDALPDTASLSTKFESNSGRYLSSVVYSGDDAKNPDCACSMRGATRLDSLYALAYVVAEKLKWDLAGNGGSPSVGRFG